MVARKMVVTCRRRIVLNSWFEKIVNIKWVSKNSGKRARNLLNLICEMVTNMCGGVDGGRQ